MGLSGASYLGRVIQRLPAIQIEGHQPTSTGNEGHPIRLMTRRVAGLDGGGPDSLVQAEVTRLFDTLAPDWHTRVSPSRTRVVADAFERGVDSYAVARALAFEVGSGIGTYTRLVGFRYASVLSLDVSFAMLSLAPIDTFRVVADGACLPAADDSADAVVLINAFLFPDEVRRVLKRGGLVVWVNSSGPDTPIHLNTEDLVAAVPFDVEGVESRAGVGTWAVLRRL